MIKLILTLVAIFSLKAFSAEAVNKDLKKDLQEKQLKIIRSIVISK